MNIASESESEIAEKLYTLSIGDGEYTFTGAKLGFGTSRRGSHINHHPNTFAPRGTRCSGCRWTDTTIYWSATDQRYIIHIVGRSVAPGEHDKVRTAWAEDADAVLDGLLISPPRHVRSNQGDTALELPQPNADALQEAAEHDPDLAAVFRAWSRGD